MSEVQEKYQILIFFMIWFICALFGISGHIAVYVKCRSEGIGYKINNYSTSNITAMSQESNTSYLIKLNEFERTKDMHIIFLGVGIFLLLLHLLFWIPKLVKSLRSSEFAFCSMEKLAYFYQTKYLKVHVGFLIVGIIIFDIPIGIISVQMISNRDTLVSLRDRIIGLEEQQATKTSILLFGLSLASICLMSLYKGER